MAKKVKAVFIASGGGTDAYSVMSAWSKGCIPEIDIHSLISTKPGEKCLEKAEKLGIDTIVIDRKPFGSIDSFNQVLKLYLIDNNIDLVFLVGCIVKIFPDGLFKTYNIHPAEPHKHGGDGMYGMEVHRRVIREIMDKIDRGKNAVGDKFYSHPTIHEVEMEYDSGHALLTGDIEIPKKIIHDVVVGAIDVDEAAKQLQQVVLPNEWLMLPAAVRMAAQKILNERSG